MPVLVVAEFAGARLRPETLSTVTAARACDSGDVHVLVAGAATAEAASAATRIAGVAKVIAVDTPTLADNLAENLAAQVLTVARRYSHVLFSATTLGKSVAPRVAAKLDVAQISDVTRVIAPDTFERPIYSGNVIATLQSSDAIRIVTVRATAFEPAAATGGVATVESVAGVADFGDSRFVSREVVRRERPELTASKVIVAGGRALGSSQQFDDVLGPLADKLNASLGASMAAVVEGYAPNDWQVGQTGKIVAPELYIACGISGSVQHLAGIRGAKVIVAINHDEEAPIFSVADYGLVADLFAAVPALVKAL
jgi:electron transfer flavoprotein alpha subunit